MKSAPFYHKRPIQDTIGSADAYYHQRGLTLIELLIVMTIISVLSIAALVSFNYLTNRGKFALMMSAVRDLEQGIESFYADNNRYPPDVTLDIDPGLVKMPTLAGPWPYWRGPYIEDWPTQTPWGDAYDYNYWASEGWTCGATIPKGIYIGILSKNYFSGGKIANFIERYALQRGLDADGCMNGEIQILFKKL